MYAQTDTVGDTLSDTNSIFEDEFGLALLSILLIIIEYWIIS